MKIRESVRELREKRERCKGERKSQERKREKELIEMSRAKEKGV
jgi:hypothetical protein